MFKLQEASTKLYNELALLNEKVAVQLPELTKKYSHAEIHQRVSRDKAIVTSRVADEYKVEHQVIQRVYDDLCVRITTWPYSKQ
ncbi:MAG: hypothetical protein IBX57_02975 [Gammaproteobacteria bacterium]|nr:hypothetical protein [Gammaproteobacteria bacterium]